jgi:uncharacterized membrane protein YbhN (UPF0104 family)
VNTFINAAETFFHHLAAVRWDALGIALALHMLRLTARTFAWRNILRAAFPGERVPRRTVFGAYVAGVGVNSILPARGGDVLKALLVKRRVPASNYPTIAATLIVETLFDTVVGLAFLIWALQLGVLPGLAVLDKLPSIDWSWPAQHPQLFAVVAGSVAAGALLLGFRLARRVREFRRRVAQGFAIVRTPWRYLREVVVWQALSWVLRVLSILWFLDAFGLTRRLHNAFLVQVVQSLSTLLPFTPGGAGTQQGFLVYVFRGQSSTTSVLSFSVGMNVALTALNVAVGFAAIALMLKTLRWRGALARDRHEQEPAAP